MWQYPHGFYQMLNMEKTDQNIDALEKVTECREEPSLNICILLKKHPLHCQLDIEHRCRCSGPPGRYHESLEVSQQVLPAAVRLCWFHWFLSESGDLGDDAVESSRTPVTPVGVETITVIVFSSLTCAFFLFPLKVFWAQASSFLSNLTSQDSTRSKMEVQTKRGCPGILAYTFEDTNILNSWDWDELRAILWQ